MNESNSRLTDKRKELTAQLTKVMESQAVFDGIRSKTELLAEFIGQRAQARIQNIARLDYNDKNFFAQYISMRGGIGELEAFQRELRDADKKAEELRAAITELDKEIGAVSAVEAKRKF